MRPDSNNSTPCFLISAGEASGEAYGAQLICALRKLIPAARFFGLGGDRMRAAGCDTIIDTRDVAVVGLAEVVSHLPAIYGEFRKLIRAADSRHPVAAILIDFPDFNFRLARKLHQRGIPVFYYVSPQLWAWRPGRIELVRKYVRKMLVIFPFEEEFYRGHGISAVHVGHPLADIIAPTVDMGNFAVANGLNPHKQWIALLPGSRRKEVEMNLPEIVRSAEILGDGYEYVLPVAPTLDPDWLKTNLTNMKASPNISIKFATDARAALAHSRAAVVASGTATVEAALIGTPFVVVYKVSPLTWKIGRRFVKVPYIAMANLIAGREIVPELVQNDFTAKKVASEVAKIVADGVPRDTMIRDLNVVRCKLHPADSSITASQRAAEAIVSELRQS